MASTAFTVSEFGTAFRRRAAVEVGKGEGRKIIRGAARKFETFSHSSDGASSVNFAARAIERIEACDLR